MMGSNEDGDPYICHSLKVCTTLISCGGVDITLSAELLQDVLENYHKKLSFNGREFICHYHLREEVMEIIRLLIKKSGLNSHELGRYSKSRSETQSGIYRIYQCFQNVKKKYRSF